MPRLFKDLIVNEGDHKARVNLLNRDGSVALHEVAVELASTAAQRGDMWGAKEANLLLKIGDDGVPYADIEGYSKTGHIHDERYYTEAEVNTLLAAKANTNHSHAAASLGAGALNAGVVAATGGDYSTSRLRNMYFTTFTPEGLADGVVCFVYE